MKKSAKTWIKSSLALLLALLAVFAFSCCAQEETKSESKGKKQDFFLMELDELEKLVSVGEYKNLSIERGSKTEEVAVWDAIVKGATVVKYPEDHVNYYANQFREQYKYYAEEIGVTYEEMLVTLGESETSILDESRMMAKKDILFAVIAKRENISITDAEKAEQLI